MIAPKLLLNLCALALSGALVAGCGGGSSSKSETTETTAKQGSAQIPLPKQPLSQWASQFQSAARSGDCPGMKKLGVGDPCSKLIHIYKGVKVVKSQQFKTGAVLDLSNHWMLLANEDGQRRWTASQGLDIGHPTIGTTADPAPARKSAIKTFAAIASRNCPQFYKYAATPGIPPSQKQKVCKSAFKGLTPIYSKNPAARPIDLGGTKNAQFFGYFLTVGKRRYYATVPVAREPKSKPPWLTLAPEPVPLTAK